MKAIALILALSLSGCASIGPALKTNEASLKAFAACGTLDTAATWAGLASNRMHEINPLTRWLAKGTLTHVFGTVGGPVVAVALLTYAGYELLKAVDKPVLTAGAAAVTCTAGVRNLYLIR